MGNWGYEPKEGDGPYDLFHSEVEMPINATVSRLLSDNVDAYGMWDRLGFLQLVLQAKIPIKIYNLNMAIATIDELTEDEEFVMSWENPNRFLASAEKIRKWLLKIIDKMDE